MLNSDAYRTPRATAEVPVGAALLVAFAAAIGFAVVAIAVVSHAGIIDDDLALAQRLHADHWPVWIGAMRVVSWMNGVVGVGVMLAALALWMWRVRAWAWLERGLLAIPGVVLLNALLKQLFARPRPYFADPLTTLSSFSFPSGHVSQSTVFYGLLAAWLCTRCAQPTGRLLIVAGAFVMVFIVALSRLFLGAHYLSDVLAAFFEGLAWLALCHVALAWRRRGRDVSGVGE